MKVNNVSEITASTGLLWTGRCCCLDWLSSVWLVCIYDDVVDDDDDDGDDDDGENDVFNILNK